MPPLAVVAMSPSGHEFSAPDYTAVSVSDDTRHTTGQVGNPNRAAVRFVFTIAEDPATITQRHPAGWFYGLTFPSVAPNRVYYLLKRSGSFSGPDSSRFTHTISRERSAGRQWSEKEKSHARPSRH